LPKKKKRLMGPRESLNGEKDFLVQRGQVFLVQTVERKRQAEGGNVRLGRGETTSEGGHTRWVTAWLHVALIDLGNTGRK